MTVSSSPPLLRRHSLALLAAAPDLQGAGQLLQAAAPDLGRGVAPLSNASARSLAASALPPRRQLQPARLFLNDNINGSFT